MQEIDNPKYIVTFTSSLEVDSASAGERYAGVHKRKKWQAQENDKGLGALGRKCFVREIKKVTSLADQDHKLR